MQSLEDLQNKVLSTQSRTYIDEATNAYNSGAYRSSILSIWIAVMVDIIEKIRMMVDQGEGAAITPHAKLTGAIANEDIRSLQEFERNILQTALDLNLIDRNGFRELARLKDDRNLCAHPAFVSDQALFNPSAELVRLHLSVAVESLLKYGPTVGKRAISRFESEVASGSFPQDDAKLKEYLHASYVNRSTDGLLRNLVIAMAKASLDPSKDVFTRWRNTRSLRAIYELRPGTVSDTLGEFLRARQFEMDDDHLLLLLGGIAFVPIVESLLDNGVKHRIESIIQTRAIADLLVQEDLFSELPPEPFGGYLRTRLRDAVLFGKSGIPDMGVPDIRLFDDLLTIFKEAPSYQDCAAAATWFTAMSSKLTNDHIGQILAAAKTTDQAYGSVLTRRELTKLKWEMQTQPGASDLFDDFDSWLQSRRNSSASDS